MLLTYSHPRFPALINAGIKIHTIREDKGNRWQSGRAIHHWMHNPRNVQKNPYPFCMDKNPVCIGVQSIDIEPLIEMVRINYPDGNSRFLEDQEIDLLALNDGLINRRIFFKWFGKSSFSGKIIHWTDLRY